MPLEQQNQEEKLDSLVSADNVGLLEALQTLYDSKDNDQQDLPDPQNPEKKTEGWTIQDLPEDNDPDHIRQNLIKADGTKFEYNGQNEFRDITQYGDGSFSMRFKKEEGESVSYLAILLNPDLTIFKTEIKGKEVNEFWGVERNSDGSKKIMTLSDEDKQEYRLVEKDGSIFSFEGNEVFDLINRSGEPDDRADGEKGTSLIKKQFDADGKEIQEETFFVNLKGEEKYYVKSNPIYNENGDFDKTETQRRKTDYNGSKKIRTPFNPLESE